MELSQAVSVAGGVLGIVAFIYTWARVGVRVDTLWEDRNSDLVARVEAAALQERVKNLEFYVLHRAQAEATVKHAIRERS